MDASKSLLVVVTVEFDVLLVLGSHLCHHLVDVLHATSSSAHRSGWEVCVTSRAIPVGEKLGGEGDRHVEVFSNALKNVTRHPKLISHVDSEDGTDLILPLAWHDFSICARNCDASKKASTVMLVSNDSTKAVVWADGAIVWTLRARVAIVRPAKRPSGELGLGTNHRVFLFNSEPRLLIEGLVEYFFGVYTEVSVSWLELLARTVLPFVGLSHNEDVITLSKGVTVKGDGPHDDLRVVCHSLETGWTIIVPFWEVSEAADFAWDGAALGAECDSCSVNPNVLCNGHLIHIRPGFSVVCELVVQAEMFLVGHVFCNYFERVLKIDMLEIRKLYIFS